MPSLDPPPPLGFSPLPPPGIDTTVASAARLYDFYIGGKDNYAADRQAAAQLLDRVPELRSMALANRMWLRRVVRYLAAECGIRQFIDIGSGLPTQDNVHQVAQRHAPDSRVVYVDNDPIVGRHAEALLAEDPATTTVVQADLRDPATILDHPDTRALIDFTQPVAILLIAVLHFLRDEHRPYEVVSTLRRSLCPGSYVAISHVENETRPDGAAFIEEVYSRSSAPAQTRSHAQIAAFFDGLDLVEPGVVPVADWRPVLGETYWPSEQAWGDAGLGRVSATSQSDREHETR